MELILNIDDNFLAGDNIIFNRQNIFPQNVAVINPYRRNEMYSFGDKQNWDQYYVSFNFVRLIAPDAEIQSADIIVYDASGVDVTDTMIDAEKTLIVGTKVLVWVRGGSQQIYKITCRIVCDNEERFEEDGELPVIEK